MSYEILTNNDDLDIQSLIPESLIFFGERHGHSKDMNVVRKIIEYVEPDYVIVEVLADLILDNKRAKEKALKLDEKDLFYERLTMMWIELASDYDMPFIGMELTEQDDLKGKSLSEHFEARETHWIKIIKKYVTSSNRVLVICGDTHLRTIKCKELGDKSPLYKTFPKAIFIRTEEPEIE